MTGVNISTGTIIWAGWIGGIAIGMYSLFQLWISNKQLGCSTAYGNFCGMGSRLNYFHIGEFSQLNNWRIWFIIGIPLGSLIAHITSPGASFEWSMNMGADYNKILPQSDLFKALVVTLGGILIGLGSRMAGGCTSGHAISGCSLLNIPSIVAAALFFIGGLFAVQLLFWIQG